MYLKSLSLLSVRNYERLELELSPGLNLFFGDNAQGKTNLLEAACFLGSLRSFRGAKGAAMVSWGNKEAKISGRVVGQGEGAGFPRRGVVDASTDDVAGRQGKRHSPFKSLSVSLSEGKRRITLDGKRPGNVREYLQALKVSPFSPEDLFLVREYPSHRRRFLDRSIFHLHPAYLELANRYKSAVGLLNAALKAGDRKVAAAYEEVLAPLAAEVSFRRSAQADRLAPLAAALYGRLSGAGEYGLSYRSKVKSADKAGLTVAYRELFEKKRDEGFKKGFCTAGPHTDDLVVTLSGRDVRTSASRGQARLALLALVLADAELYSTERGEAPVLLLDDAASELDDRRKGALMEYIAARGQALLTSTDAGLLAGHGGQAFKVDGGRVTAA